MPPDKELRWIGSSLSDLLEFPAAARRDAGFQLGKVQAGLEPSDWKPFAAAGPGTFEIRVRDGTGAFRILLVARFEEAVYVLHCFQKKTATTRQQDKAIATARYRSIATGRNSTP